jgi:DNA gyrase subunit A
MRGLAMRDEDFVESLFVSYNHDYLLFFTDHGQCYWLRVFEIPEGTRTSKGRSIRNLIQIPQEDRVRAILPVTKENFLDEDFRQNHFVLMATRQGVVKKTALEAFRRPRVDGIIAIVIDEGDQLIEAHLTSGDSQVVLASSAGLAIRFRESDVRSMGRKSRGVRGISLGPGQRVVGMVVIESDTERDLLAISAKGYGKRSVVEDYRLQGRGGKGIITMKATSRTGELVAIKGVEEKEDLMISTTAGVMIRMKVDSIRSMGRNTQGVRLIKIRDEDAIADITRVILDEGEDAVSPGDQPADGSDGGESAPQSDGPEEGIE